jgi:hypothetical protein
MCKGYKVYYIRRTLSRLNQLMQAKDALTELENKVRELEARVKKLENWKLVHTSMSEEKEKNT